MERKFLEDLGLTKEQIDSVMTENGKDINKAKGDIESVNAELHTAKETIKERDTQLENLKGSVGDNKELKLQIENLQTENKTTKENYEAEIKELKLSNAIKLAILDTAQDVDLVTSLFDKSKLILSDDGKVTGLEEQLKVIKESKSFLFKEEKNLDNKNNQQIPPGFIFGSQPSNQQNAGERMSMKEAIASRLQGINNSQQ
ncbi:phage scaffolding protein [Intestinibacter bartlettii]|uniref:phage scaffolding protein n=1 Tax=Intestinibacter bartlettii TaxID=261299 RepID=UPI00242A9E93|nr:phage scaffolding protein [Intestinibacter bartlettii]